MTGPAEHPFHPTERHLRVKVLVQVLVLALLCAAGAILAEHLALRATQADARASTLRDLGEMRSLIENRLTADVQLVQGMLSYVRSDPAIDQARFARIAGELMSSGSPYVRNMALARDLVITHMHPIPGNEAALGLDYRTVPAQWTDVETAVRERQVVISGPLDLVQGGTALIARFPIFLPAEGARDGRLWGMAASVIDLEAFLAGTVIDRFDRQYRMTLSILRGEGAAAELFWGDSELQSQDTVQVAITLLSKQWLLSAMPVDGWPDWSEQLPVIVAVALVLFLLAAALITVQHRNELNRTRNTRLLEAARNEAVAARLTAERANSAKSAFLANMSHDLRTPLNSIIGFSELIRDQVFGPGWHPKYGEYIRHISDCGTILVDMIDDMLDLTRIEAGDYPLQPEWIDMPALLREVQSRWLLRGQVGDRLQLGIAADAPPRLLADLRAVQRILDNLVSNALRYAGEQASIRMLWEPGDGGGGRLAVVDDGPGIPAEQIAHLTEPFYQGGTDHGRRADQARRGAGHGLGLSIVKRLAGLHGADLRIESEVGAGAAFYVTFPQERRRGPGA